jgi:hypothetical protein
MYEFKILYDTHAIKQFFFKNLNSKVFNNIYI